MRQVHCFQTPLVCTSTQDEETFLQQNIFFCQCVLTHAALVVSRDLNDSDLSALMRTPLFCAENMTMNIGPLDNDMMWLPRPLAMSFEKRRSPQTHLQAWPPVGGKTESKPCPSFLCLRAHVFVLFKQKKKPHLKHVDGFSFLKACLIVKISSFLSEATMIQTRGVKAACWALQSASTVCSGFHQMQTTSRTSAVRHHGSHEPMTK